MTKFKSEVVKTEKSRVLEGSEVLLVVGSWYWYSLGGSRVVLVDKSWMWCRNEDVQGESVQGERLLYLYTTLSYGRLLVLLGLGPVLNTYR